MKILIASDSTHLFEIYSNKDARSDDRHPIYTILNSRPNIKLALIKWKFNVKADTLAKEGKHKSKILAGWNFSK